MKFANTTQKGSARVIIFKQNSTWFGVALDFNIVETGDDPREVMIMLDEAIKGYVLSAQKAKLRPHVLNQKADKEYEDLWEKLESKMPIPSPIKVHSYGIRTLSAV